MNEIQLYEPSYIDLEDAYRGMAKLASIRIKTRKHQDTLGQLEKIGFVGMKLEFTGKDLTEAIIRAYKGKHGPCRHQGVKAVYSGAALAVLDDDNHLLLRNTPKDICDKTHKIYELSIYRSLITCEDTAAMGRVKKVEPVDGASQLDRDASVLYEWTKDTRPDMDDRVPLFYPGPFRLLILEDGTLVRRGHWSMVPGIRVKAMRKEGGLIQIEPGYHVSPRFYQLEYHESGPGFMLFAFNPKEKRIETMDTDPDLRVLGSIVPNLRKRIEEVIRNERKYFILVGNEIDEIQGCCPSEEVTDAKKLVKHGVLESISEPVQGDACPVTLFAFSGEISKKNDLFDIKLNTSFRDLVLKEMKKSPWRLYQNIIKWVLLFFVIISAVIGIWRGLPTGGSISENEIMQKFNPYAENKLQVILFHNEKRCFQCLEIERLCREVINKEFPDQASRAEVVFSTIVIDDPLNYGLVDYYGVYGPLVVLVRFDDDGITRSKVLNELSGQYRDPETFRNHFKSSILELMNTTNG